VPCPLAEPPLVQDPVFNGHDVPFMRIDVLLSFATEFPRNTILDAIHREKQILFQQAPR